MRIREETMEVQDIVIKHLKDNDFDGLYNDTSECGCGLDDLAPCGESTMDCKPAIEVVPPTKDFDRFFADKGWDQTKRINVATK